MILLLAAPTAYFLSAPYPEALVLCAVLAAVHAARTGRWARAGIAGASRVVGFALCPLLVLNQVGYGTPLQFVHVQKDRWNQGLAWPWVPIRDALNALDDGVDGDLRFIMWTRLATIAVRAPLLFSAWRRLPKADLAYAWVAFLLVMSSVWLLSLPRSVLVLYPLFIVGAQLTERRRVFVPVVGVCACPAGVVVLALRRW